MHLEGNGRWVLLKNHSLRQKYSGHFHLTLFFLFLARLLVLSMLFTAVNSPNLAQGKRTVKCPNNLD